MTETNSNSVRRKSRNNGSAGNSPFNGNTGDGRIRVGDRLREIRSQSRLSIRALAAMSGLNVNTLSLIENGRTSPSVSTLQQLARSLQVPITTFFETDHGEKKAVFQKNGARPRATFAHGLMEDLGAGMPYYGVEPLILALNPHADSGKHPMVYTGREFVYCIEGQIAYTVDSEMFLLEPGDSLLFDAYLPHHLKNMNATPSRVLLVLCPLDNCDRPTERHFVI